MLLTYQECLAKYGNDYRIKKEIGNGTLFMKEKGVYSTERNIFELDIIMLKYPSAVCTGESAFYFHSLTDVIPDHYHLATRRNATRIRDPRVRQSFLKDDIFASGITEMRYNQSSVRIYNRERMLIELLRFRRMISMEYYKEIIQNYRKLAYELDFGLVEDYAALFKSGAKLMNMVQMEVL